MVADPMGPSPAFHPALMLPRVMQGQKLHTRRVWENRKRRYDEGNYYLREPVNIVAVEGTTCTIEYCDRTHRVVEAQPHRKDRVLSMPVVGKSRGRAPIPWEWARYKFTVLHRWEHRLQEISEEDLLKEGIEGIESHGQQLWRNYKREGELFELPLFSFMSLWDLLNVPGERWADNPVVQAIEFEIHLLTGEKTNDFNPGTARATASPVGLHQRTDKELVSR